MNKKKILVLLSVLFTIVGCIRIEPRVDSVPSELPNAYLNTPYAVDFYLVGNKVDKSSVKFAVSNRNFKIEPIEREDGYDEYYDFRIIGTATNKDPIKINVSGQTYSLFKFNSKRFDFDYTIMIKELYRPKIG